MVQFKKDDIKEKIDKAALEIFAAKGYAAAKVADIADRAGVSVGNIYRYYKGKDEILAAVLPETFLPEAQDFIFTKIGAFGAGQTTEFSQKFAEFMVANKERLLILISGSHGTQYENLKTEVARFLLKTVRENYPEQLASFDNVYQNEAILLRIYEGLVDIYADVLRTAANVAQLEHLVKVVNGYHLYGITGLLEIKP